MDVIVKPPANLYLVTGQIAEASFKIATVGTARPPNVVNVVEVLGAWLPRVVSHYSPDELVVKNKVAGCSLTYGVCEITKQKPPAPGGSGGG